MPEDGALTPAMRQFQAFKRQHPDCLLLFRMGDFYELFFEDAKTAHRVLGVTLTQRTEGVPMAGVPYHAVEGYLRRLIQAGHRVAVCDQVEDPKLAKGVVKRDVTRLVTPGTLTDEHLLDENAPNVIAAVDERQGVVAAAWAELSTGRFEVGDFTRETWEDELSRIAPRELLCRDEDTGDAPGWLRPWLERSRCTASPRPAWQFSTDDAAQRLREHYGVSQLAGLGLEERGASLGPAGALLTYLKETQPRAGALKHLAAPRRYEREGTLVIDETSLRSLEIERTARSGETDGTLLGLLTGGGACRTAMGRRLMRLWVCYPLKALGPIEQRLRAVDAMTQDPTLRDALRGQLDEVQDVARIVARIGVARATPRDLVALARSAARASPLRELLADRPAMQPLHAALAAVAESIHGWAMGVMSACVESPPAHLREGGLIRDGVDALLDESRSLQRNSQDWLMRYQAQLVEQTGIASLKIGFNKVFGYYIEVTAAHRARLDAQPDLTRGWSRKQTLKNAERYITDELKRYEDKVLHAEQEAVAREQVLFDGLLHAATGHTEALQRFAETVATLDALACLAHHAVKRRWVRPEVVDEPVMRITGGRHPVLDDLLGDRFVPNDAVLGQGGATLALITGPNMAGKSTYIRQAALIALLAHVGSFVPAEAAVVGLCDRIFTRIGSSDELHAGRSTFMVEMVETARICRFATARSLVILDEIGRGTSTLDGLSLAWAITEHLARVGCRTMFATHYHELTQLAESVGGAVGGIVNLNVSVRQWQEEIVFLHRIVPGAADRSYGVHVAKLAGLPPAVVQRADALLKTLEGTHAVRKVNPGVNPGGNPGGNPGWNPGWEEAMPLFREVMEPAWAQAVRSAKLEAMSPLEAFDLLRRIKQEMEGSAEAGG